MTRFGAARLGLVGLAVAASLAACGQGEQVASPKDPSNESPCDLVPSQTIHELGFHEAGEETTDGCTWKSAGGGVELAVGVEPERSVQDFRDEAAKYSDFGELTVGEHPAVRANSGDPKADGKCELVVAANAEQAVSAKAKIPSGATADPCALAQRALDAAVPSWPAAE
ncbi:hypothetical protein GCM10027271_44230 [Saccharopolyspora gloriosae]|uniref:DUF3558 domain-containing protein n=1 Tax=Saccharopolyspora gloriosae TaxID=455344 RepID=A0A840NPW1_9PSEU|nr:DUF3558 family protein [Saccharopolyspora gloriosae]MBB5070277.1 hypothetical protein [Saccharopolyspora gloriosae]